MSQKISRAQIPLEEMTITPGSACQGCGAALAARLAFKALGPNTIRHGVPCCPDSSTKTQRGGGGVFEGGGAALTGTYRALKALGVDEGINIVGFFGDGGTYDIGFQGISAAAARNENIWVITKDNEAYMNTGNQQSTSTPLYSMTTTTPVGSVTKGKQTGKKESAMIFAAHNEPYVATATVAYPEDLLAKINYGKTVKGFKMIIIQSPCPVGWRFDPSKTIEVARLGVQTGVWPLYEVVDGEQFKLTYKPKELKPVAEYYKSQARFRHVTDDQMAGLQADVTKKWETLLKGDEAGRPML